MSFDDQSQKLLESEIQSEDGETATTILLERFQHQRRTRRLHLGVLYFMNAMLMVALVVTSTSKYHACIDPSLKTYCINPQEWNIRQELTKDAAPANVAVEYEEVMFHDLPGEWSPYFGEPNDEKDRLWDELYTGKLLKIAFTMI